MCPIALLALAICTQQTDLDMVQGNWILVRHESNGKISGVQCRRQVKGSNLSDVVDGRPLPPLKLRLDETQTPKIWETETSRGLKLAIYKVEDDILTICYPITRDIPLPKVFEARPGDNTILCVFKRETK